MLAADQTGNSGRRAHQTFAWTLLMETPALLAISQRRREESSTVPEESTRFGGQAGDLLGNDGENVTGLVTSMMIALGLRTVRSAAASRGWRRLRPPVRGRGWRASGGTGGDDDHVAVAQQFDVVATGYGCFVCEHCAVGDVQCLSVRACRRCRTGRFHLRSRGP